MKVLSNIPLIRSTNRILVDRLVDESLQKTRDVYEKKIRLIEQQYRKEIKELEQSHQITFNQYKKEHEDLVADIVKRAEDTKKDAAKEMKKAKEVYREAMETKEKFSKLLYKVKTLYSGIDSIMKSTVVAETEIVNMIHELERSQKFKNFEDTEKEKPKEAKISQIKPSAIM